MVTIVLNLAKMAAIWFQLSTVFAINRLGLLPAIIYFYGIMVETEKKENWERIGIKVKRLLPQLKSEDNEENKKGFYGPPGLKTQYWGGVGDNVKAI